MQENLSNKAKAVLLVAALVALGLPGVDAFAADLPGAKDHPLLKRFGGSEIVGYDFKRFDTYDLQTSTFKTFDLKSNKDEFVKPPLRVEGAITRFWYEAAGDATSTEVARNYLNELKAKGFQILYDSAEDPKAKHWSMFLAPFRSDRRKARVDNWALGFAPDASIHSITAKLERPEGNVYVAVITVRWEADNKDYKVKRGVYASVDVIETTAMKQNMVVASADEMSQSIASLGRVALYGIFFDSDKAEILPKSKPALGEIAKLLQKEPALNLRVVGHTDAVGGMEANLALSRRRAEAVMAALTKQYQVAASRLTSHGVSSLAPLATNGTEDGRAKNRRVELVPFVGAR